MNKIIGVALRLLLMFLLLLLLHWWVKFCVALYADHEIYENFANWIGFDMRLKCYSKQTPLLCFSLLSVADKHRMFNNFQRKKTKKKKKKKLLWSDKICVHFSENHQYKNIAGGRVFCIVSVYFFLYKTLK